MLPKTGLIVAYTLSQQDAEAIRSRRTDAARSAAKHREEADGSQIHMGNQPAAGNVYPMIITRAWGKTEGSAVNGQVLLDGNDTHWVTSVTEGEGERHFAAL